MKKFLAFMMLAALLCVGVAFASEVEAAEPAVAAICPGGKHLVAADGTYYVVKYGNGAAPCSAGTIVRHSKCARCDVGEWDELDPFVTGGQLANLGYGHNYVKDETQSTTAASCLVGYVTVNVCSNCQDAQVITHSAALGHIWEDTGAKSYFDDAKTAADAATTVQAKYTAAYNALNANVTLLKRSATINLATTIKNANTAVTGPTCTAGATTVGYYIQCPYCDTHNDTIFSSLPAAADALKHQDLFEKALAANPNALHSYFTYSKNAGTGVSTITTGTYWAPNSSNSMVITGNIDGMTGDQSAYLGIPGAKLGKLKLTYTPASCLTSGSMVITCVDCGLSYTFTATQGEHDEVYAVYDNTVAGTTIGQYLGKKTDTTFTNYVKNYRIAKRDCTYAVPVSVTCEDCGTVNYCKYIETTKSHSYTGAVLMYQLWDYVTGDWSVQANGAPSLPYTEANKNNIPKCVKYRSVYQCVNTDCVCYNLKVEKEFAASKNHVDNYKELESTLTILYTKPANCDTAGYKKVMCPNCGYEDTVEIKALGHFWAVDTDAKGNKNATCTTDGFLTYECTRKFNADGTTTGTPTIQCTASKTDTPKATGHKFNYTNGDAITKGTWIAKVYAEKDLVNGDCEGWTGASDYATKTTFSSALTSKVYDIYAVCQNGGCTEKEFVKHVDGHVWKQQGTLTGSTSCTDTAAGTYKCDKCGNLKTENIGGSHPTWVAMTDAQAKALITNIATSTNSTWLAANYKIAGQKKVDGTAVAAGDLAKGFSMTGSFVKYTAPTCKGGENKAGFWTMYCPLCGEALKTVDDTVTAKPTGHSIVWNDATKYYFDSLPSCTAEGKLIYTCGTCHEYGLEKTLPKLAHNWVSEVKDGKTVMVCKDVTALNVSASNLNIKSIEKVMLDAGYVNTTAGYNQNELFDKLLARYSVNNATQAQFKKYTGCGATEATTVNAPSYTPSYNRGDNYGTIKLDEKCSALKKVYVKLSWRYTLGSGETIAFTTIRPVTVTKDDGANGVVTGTFSARSISVPASATLDFFYVQVVDSESVEYADFGTYTDYGTKFF